MHAHPKRPSEKDKEGVNKKTSTRNTDTGNFSTNSFEKMPPETSAQFKFKEGAKQNIRTHQLMAFQAMANSHSSKTIQRKELIEKDNQGSGPNAIQRKETNLPSDLKQGIENISGYSMEDVQVHHNSKAPAQLQALAYAQGTDIHLGPGQEKHLPHEAWHVVQQKQGRVQPTAQLKEDIAINDDKVLEHEADIMGAKALQSGGLMEAPLQKKSIEGGAPASYGIVQRQVDGTEENPTAKKKKTLTLRGEKKGFGTALKNFFTEGTTFTKLEKKVKQFNSASAEVQEKLGKEVENLAMTWLKDHSSETDENNVAKRESILEVLKEIRKGDRIKEAVKFGAFKSEEHAEKLGFSEQNVDKEASEKTKDFVSSDGKIKDVKGMIKDTSFMTEMYGVMKEKVMSIESNLGQIDSNEKKLRADAAMHSFFESEKTKADAKGPDERRGVTQHAKDSYLSGFHPNIIGKGKFPTDGKSGKMFQDEDELFAEKLSKYKASSLAGAQEVHGLNEEADIDLATVYALTEQVQTLKTKEEESFKNPLLSGLGGHEEHAQANRQQVKLLVEDAILYAQKVQLEKQRSQKLVQPLDSDGRLAGFWSKAWDMTKTTTANQITKMLTLGLTSAGAKYTVGGLASSESFDLEEDSEGNLTEVVKHEGNRGDSKYNFTGPRGVVKGILGKIRETGTKAAKFKNKKPITGFFIFSGVLQQFEKGLAYINQIAGTIKNWATGLSFIPGAAAITTPIAAVCQAISQAISLITQSSKAARMIFTSLVKIMNEDPQLWGLVSQNFNAGVAENLASLGTKGAEVGYAAGMSPLLGTDAGEGASSYLKNTTNLDSRSIESNMIAKAAISTTDSEQAIGIGQSSVELGDSIASGGTVENAMNKGIKENKKGVARPIRAIEAFKTAAKSAGPKAKPVILGSETVLDKTKQTETLADKIIPEVQKAETQKQQTSDSSDPEVTAANQEFQKQTSTTKKEARDISSTTEVVQDVASEVVKSGNVATMKALWEKRIKEAEKEKMRGRQG